MSKPTFELGKLITKQEHRDATHIAICPVIAREKLKPGQHVLLVEGSTMEVVGSETKAAVGLPIGIVDPFLKQTVQPGQSFWLFLYPNTVTSLRHEWEHPLFKQQTEEDRAVSKLEKQKKEAVEWLTNFAYKLEMSYDDLMSAAETYIKTNEYYCLEFDTPGFVYDEAKEMWGHIATATTNPFDIPNDREETFFRCAC